MRWDFGKVFTRHMESANVSHQARFSPDTWHQHTITGLPGPSGDIVVGKQRRREEHPAGPPNPSGPARTWRATSPPGRSPPEDADDGHEPTDLEASRGSGRRPLRARRQPLSGGSGRADLTRSDSTHPSLFVECKYRERHAARTLYDATKGARPAGRQGPRAGVDRQGPPGVLALHPQRRPARRRRRGGGVARLGPSRPDLASRPAGATPLKWRSTRPKAMTDGRPRGPLVTRAGGGHDPCQMGGPNRHDGLEGGLRSAASRG